MTPAGSVLLFGLLGSVSSLLPPRTSFLLNSTGRPLVHFSHPSIRNTTTLLLSGDGSTLYVGARDAVLSLDVSQSDVIRHVGEVQWSPTEADVDVCVTKGKKREVDCSNFIRVLQMMNSTHLYVCGSYAYSPQDAYINIDGQNLAMVPIGAAKGRCPFSPFQRNAALSVDGELFTASTSDFRGFEPVIGRHFSKDGRPDVSQDPSTSLLEEPNFVSAALDPAENKLYFFFNEVGKEFSYVNELRTARVAQVCKDDVGGQRTLQRKWTSFAKSSLVCRAPRRLPFNVLRDVFRLSAAPTEFYAVFTSQWSSGPESAVCVFTLQDIRAAFMGAYRTYDSGNHLWVPLQGKHSYLGKCGLENATDAELNEVKKSFLTALHVEPAGNGPVLVSSQQTYRRIAAMRTEAADGKWYTVLFLLTESGFLHKVVLSETGARVVEEIQVWMKPQLVRSLVLSSSKGVLYVGTSEGVTAVPVANCSIYTSCSQCVLARDPLCGWSPTRKVCTGLEPGAAPLIQDLENGTATEKCPQQRGARLDSAQTDMTVDRGQAVQLRCVKPSNLATLTWTTPNRTQQNLYVQTGDSLSFLATTDTFGIYSCVAEEGGHSEVVATFDVRPVSPRSARPRPDGSNATEEAFEAVDLKEAMSSIAPPNTEDFTQQTADDTARTRLKGENITRRDFGRNAVLGSGLDLVPVSKNAAHKANDPVCEFQREKNYFKELLVVSLLMVLSFCLLILGGLQMWRLSKAGNEASSQTGPETRTMETVPSLSPVDNDPDLKVV